VISSHGKIEKTEIPHPEGAVEATAVDEALKVVHLPTIHGLERVNAAMVVNWLTRLGFRIFGPELFLESQVVVVVRKLGGLQQTSDLGLTLALSRLSIPLLLLLLLSIQLGVVSRKLLQLDEEITEVQFEPVICSIQREQSFNERFDLGTVRC
jgi:hypothetical protein